MPTLRFTQAARAELIEAQDWYETQAPGLGGRFRGAIDATATRIISGPLQIPIILKPLRRARVRRFPYSLFYVMDGDELLVVACFGMRPVHPGEVLREDYLKPAGMSVNAMARALNVPASRLNDIVLERRGVTPDTALRLARALGTDAASWLNMQTAHDLRRAEITSAAKIAKAVRPLALTG